MHDPRAASNRLTYSRNDCPSWHSRRRVSGPKANQQTAEEAVETVADFREETASRLETLEELAAIDDVDMGDLFSPSFYETVQKNQDEWLDALDDLESAFEAYAADGSEPVEAHLYDLFEYYDDLVGSTHYASNGILFMTYYFREVRRRRTVPDRGHRGVGAPASPLRVSHWPRFVREARERGLSPKPVIPSRVTFLPTGRIEALSR